MYMLFYVIKYDFLENSIDCYLSLENYHKKYYISSLFNLATDKLFNNIKNILNIQFFLPLLLNVKYIRVYPIRQQFRHSH